MPLLKTLRTKVVPAKAARPNGPGSAMNIVGLAGMGLSAAVVVRPWSRSMLWLDMECFLSSPAGQARAQAGSGVVTCGDGMSDRFARIYAAPGGSPGGAAAAPYGVAARMSGRFPSPSGHPD